MSFKISVVHGQPQFDTLPVAKIIDYPMEERDYKPFAQAIICINEEGLIIRMWAFEVQPERESSLRAVFALSPAKSSSTLSVEIFPDRRVRFCMDGVEREAACLHVHHFTGEDLQGLYWGATILLPHDFLHLYYPGLVLESEKTVRGNLYKLCTGERPHNGSYLPVDFTKDPFSPGQLGEFDIVFF